jgi:hypothetical protein
MILENKSRKELIKTVSLFMIKLSFMALKNRTKDLDFISTEKIDMQQRSFKSNFFDVRISSKQNYTMRFESKIEGRYVYNITIFNMEHLRAVVHFSILCSLNITI